MKTKLITIISVFLAACGGGSSDTQNASVHSNQDPLVAEAASQMHWPVAQLSATCYASGVVVVHQTDFSEQCLRSLHDSSDGRMVLITKKAPVWFRGVACDISQRAFNNQKASTIVACIEQAI